MSHEYPIVDWTPESGIDPFAVRWRARTAEVRGIPYGPGLELLPQPRPGDWMRHCVEVEKDGDPAVAVAVVPNTELAKHIAKLHNDQLDAG
jgi:hypothetical protein